MNIVRLKKTFLMVMVPFALQAQVGVGTSNPNSAAALEIESTSKGFLPPRMTSIQLLAVQNPPEGLMVYCTDCATKGIHVFDGVYWSNIRTESTPNYGVITTGTGRTWLDRNLGASQVATSATDVDAYGGLYQWGRNTDGHQLRSSPSVVGPVAAGSEGANFITTTSSPNDWLITQDDVRWNGSTKGAHDPCPAGFRIPTIDEWITEINSFTDGNTTGGFNVLKLTIGGYRQASSGNTTSVTALARYWSSSVSSAIPSFARDVQLWNSGWSVGNTQRAQGNSVRCIKEQL